MARNSELNALLSRFVAFDDALRRVLGAGRPGFARQCAALVALSSSEPPDVLVARIRERARELRGARGAAGATRPVFAAALAVSGRSAADYLSARASLLPAMEGLRRRTLPAAALTYAVAGRTELSDADQRRIRDLGELSAAPWWSNRMVWNGFYAAALALRFDASAAELRLNAASRALRDAGAPEDVFRHEARRLALTDADPAAAAATWRLLEDARAERRLPGKPPPGLLVAYAARAADRPRDAVSVYAQAMDGIAAMRPRPHALIRPHLAVGLAAQALSPGRRAGDDVTAALEAALLVVQANEEMAAVMVAAGAGAAASG